MIYSKVKKSDSRHYTYFMSVFLQGFTKANMRLLWDKSDPVNVHPYKKGLALAKAMGVKLRDHP